MKLRTYVTIRPAMFLFENPSPKAYERIIKLPEKYPTLCLHVSSETMDFGCQDIKAANITLRYTGALEDPVLIQFLEEINELKEKT